MSRPDPEVERTDRQLYTIAALLLLLTAIIFRACEWDNLAQSILFWGMVGLFAIEALKWFARRL